MTSTQNSTLRKARAGHAKTLLLEWHIKAAGSRAAAFAPPEKGGTGRCQTGLKIFISFGSPSYI
jgi:hypothetical protein